VTGIERLGGDAVDLLRVACGAFFLPHAWAKIASRPLVTGFFEAAGLRPAALFVNAALAIELALALALIGGVAVAWAGVLAAAFLCAAALAVFRVSKGAWLWNKGGAEFCLFWAIACLAVAIDAAR
jgi:putative oxidoreductase